MNEPDEKLRIYNIDLNTKTSYYTCIKTCNYLLHLYPMYETDSKNRVLEVALNLPPYYINSGMFYWFYRSVSSRTLPRKLDILYYNFNYLQHKHYIHNTDNEQTYIINLYYQNNPHILLVSQVNDISTTTEIPIKYDYSTINESLGDYIRHIVHVVYDTLVDLDIPKNQLSPKLKVDLYNNAYENLLTPILDRIDPDTLLVRE